MKKKCSSFLLAIIMVLSILPMPKAGADVSGDDIVSTAMQYIGKVPYVWGGKTIDGNNPGADCGGFVCAIYDKCGISIWKHRGHLQNAGTNLGTDLNVALTGDIIWFPGHVAIYAGKDSNGNHMIVQETSDPYNNVCYTKASIVRGGVNGVIEWNLNMALQSEISVTDPGEETGGATDTETGEPEPELTPEGEEETA